jgi:excisionase family DNA binding protein
MHSLPQAAKLLGLAPSTLRHQVKNGKLRAVKVSRDWYITTEEVERYRTENRQAIKDVPA